MSSIQRRRTLELERLDVLHKQSNSPTGSEIPWAYWRRYNDIISSLEDIERETSIDPIKRFPVEIWSSIVAQAATATQDRQPYIAVDGLLELSLVSNLWREAILDTPSLWSDIQIDDQMEDLLAKIHMGIYLSKDTPLRLYVVSPMRSWNEVATHVTALRRRLRSVLISGLNTSRLIPDSLIPVLNDLAPLPNVDEIGSTVEASKAPPLLLHKILLQKNSLRQVFNIPLSEESLSAPGAWDLENIMVDSHSQSMLRCITRLPRLQTVTFRRLPSLETPRRASYDMREMTREYNGMTIRWGTLYFSRRPSALGLLLISLGEQTLSDVSLTIHMGRIPLLLDALGAVKRLSILRLELVPDTTYQGIDLSTSIAPLTIKRLYLSFFIGCNAGEEGLEKEFFHTLATTFARCMPFVNQLRIYDKRRRLSAPFLDILACMTAVEDVEVHTWAAIAHTEARTDPFPQWKGVKVVGTESVAVIFQSHRVTDLTLRSSTKNTRPKATDPVAASLTSPGSIGRTHDSIKDAPFKYLRRLYLRGTSLQMTRLCHQIASRPHALPSLESISMCSYPCWDILFLMLERRNMSTVPNLCRIGYLELPALVSPLIADLLRELLRGRFLQWRPSNYELSSDNIENRLYDSNFTTCMECLQAFRTLCPFDTSGPSQRLSPIDRTDPYPFTDEGVIASFPRRSTMIIHKWFSKSEGLALCPRLEHRRMLSIS
ncbi:hypothetical protein FRC19_004051 [Serendipita sp. 401]|nr:hypothetical protein FRC19_004051 [Serendipita sp. 401]